MKFDINKWKETPVDTPTKIQTNPVHILSSEETALYLAGQGTDWVLASVGTRHKIDCSQAVEFVIDVKRPEVRAFIETPIKREPPKKAKTVFTNIDRMPSESGTAYEVKKGLHELKMFQNSIKRDAQRLARREAAFAKQQLNEKMAKEMAENADPKPAAKKPDEPKPAETTDTQE